jgi:hypothetical protein
VNFKKPSKLPVPKPQFDQIQATNQYLWTQILPELDFENKLEAKDIDLKESSEQLFTATSYSDLRRQYLIYPTLKDSNGEFKFDIDILKRLTKKLTTKKKSSKFNIKQATKYMFKLKSSTNGRGKSKNKLYML